MVVRNDLERFHLVMDVEYSDHDAVCLSRVPHEPSDPEKFEVVWRVAAGPPTRLAIELCERAAIPRDYVAAVIPAKARNGERLPIHAFQVLETRAHFDATGHLPAARSEPASSSPAPV